MKTIKIGDRLYKANVERVHYAPDWPGRETLGDIGGYVDILPGMRRSCWVLSKDNEVFVPCSGHEKMLQEFLEGR